MHDAVCYSLAYRHTTSDHAHFGYTSTLSSLVEFEYHILPVVATCQEMSNGRQHPLKVSEHRGEITEYIKS